MPCLLPHAVSLIAAAITPLLLRRHTLPLILRHYADIAIFAY